MNYMPKKNNILLDEINFKETVAWLKQQQNNDGSYASENDIALPVQSTSETLNAFYTINLNNDSSQESALIYLNTSHDDNTETLSRRIIANAQYGVDNSDLVLQLKSYQNQNGGFGFSAGFDSFVLDTAWALKALVKAGLIKSKEVNNAITWLSFQQQTNGSWSNDLGQNDVYSSAIAMNALWECQNVYNINNILKQGVDWLLGQRNIDGVWAFTDHTALVLLAVLPALDDLNEIKQAIDYLVSTQNNEKNWDEDVYVTALVLHALNNIGLMVDTETPLLQGKVIDAESRQPLAGVNISFQGQFTSTDNSGEFILPLKNTGDSQISFSLSSYTEIVKNIIISELKSFQLGTVQLKRKSNSSIIKGFITDQQTGTAIDGLNITLSDGQIITTNNGYYHALVEPGTITLTIIAHNYRTISADIVVNDGETVDFSPALILKQNSVPNKSTISGRILDDQSMLPIMGAIIEQDDGIQQTTGKDGVFKFTDLTKNSYTYIIKSKGYDKKDIQISITGSGEFNLGDILLHKEAAVTGSIIQGIISDAQTGKPLCGAKISITGANNKTIYSNAEGNYKFDGLKAGEIDINVSIDGYEEASTHSTIDNCSEYILSVGLHANVESGSDNPGNTGNNEKTAIKGIIVDAATGLPLSEVVIAATVKNITTVKVTDNTGEFLFEDIDDEIVSLTFTRKNYRYTAFEISMFQQHINDLGQIRLPEINNLNDEKLADLVIDFVDPKYINTDQQNLEVSGTLRVTISNTGKVDVPPGISLIAFKDNNRNGMFDAGIDTILGQIVTNQSLKINQTDIFTIPVSGKLDFKDAPIYVLVDSENRIEEINKQNNISSTALAAKLKPEIGQLEPVLEWTTGELNVASGVLVIPTRDTNDDGVIDNTDTPSIIFLSHKGAAYNYDGTLHIIDGRDKSELLKLYRPNNQIIAGRGGIAAADIDNDGQVEVLIPTTNGQLMAINTLNGEVKWTSRIPNSPYYGRIWGGGPSIADLNGDGKVEILFGRHVLNADDGSVLWSGRGSFHGGKTGLQSFAADINLDGYLELIVGASAYDYQGNLLWQNNAVGDGFTAVGQFKKDDYPQIVVSAVGRLFMLDHEGKIIWGPVRLPGGGNGGSPVIADVDGDGIPEIGVAGAYFYTVFKADGSILWSRPNQDSSSAETGSSVFDFDGDGRAEVLYADEQNLFIFDGETGQQLYKLPHGSDTGGEYPVIADVDNDGHAELIVVGDGNRKNTGLQIYKGKNNSWVRTRNIWNQYDYYINNINDDLTIPAHQQNSWDLHNTFRLNRPLDLDPTVVADLTASYIRIDNKFEGSDSTITVRIGNGGGYPAPAGVFVAFYNGNPKDNGILLGVQKTTRILNSNDYEDVTLQLPCLKDINILYIVADDNGKGEYTVEEANRNNNVATLELANLSYGVLKISTEKNSYTPQTDVVFQSMVSNIGYYNSIFKLQLSILDFNGKLVAELPIVSLGEISTSTTIIHENIWNTDLYIAGEYKVCGKLLDIHGNIVAEDSCIFAILANTDENSLASISINTDKPEYISNDVVELTTIYRNLSINTPIFGAYLEINVKSPDLIDVFSHKEAIGDIPANGSFNHFNISQFLHEAQLGEYTVVVTLFNSEDKKLANATTSYLVTQDPKCVLDGIRGSLTLNKRKLSKWQTLSRTDSVSNNGEVNVENLKIIRVIVNEVGQGETNLLEVNLDLKVDQKQDWLNIPVNTKILAAGNYTALLIAAFNGESKLLDSKNFEVNENSVGLGISETTLITTGAALHEGLVYIWGFRGSAQQGNGTVSVESESPPAKVETLKNIISLTGGAYHLLALDDQGNVYGWGKSNNGETGCEPTHKKCVATPALVLSNIIQIAAGEYSSMALDTNGLVWTWGQNIHGQLGNPDIKHHSQTPIAVDLNGEKARLIGATYEGGFAVTEEGHVWAWGDNEANGLGIQGSNYGKQSIIKIPTQVPNLDIYAAHIIYIGGGNGWGEALLDNGDVIGWGLHAALGLGVTKTKVSSPEPVHIISNVKQLFARYVGSIALTNDGEIYTWGQTSGSAFPMIYGADVTLRNNTNGSIISIGGGKEHIFYRTEDGNLYGVGYNDIYKLDQSKSTGSAIDWPGKQIILNP
jgi:alpha-tubulin suppressor-like RCC1 family protein